MDRAVAHNPNSPAIVNRPAPRKSGRFVDCCISMTAKHPERRAGLPETPGQHAL